MEKRRKQTRLSKFYGGLKVGLALVSTIYTFAMVAIATAQQPLRININNPNISPLTIAIADFIPDQASENDLAVRITRIVQADLGRSGLFRNIDKNAFIQTAGAVLQNAPRYQDWQAIGAQALVVGKMSRLDDGRLRLEFYLYDINSKKRMVALALTATASDWRRIGHKIADNIYSQLTGEDGYFDTQILYIAETGPQNNRQKKLAIMDQDGENNQFLSDGRVLIITPRFSPNSREITYMAYTDNQPRVYLFNLETGQQELLGDFPGMTFAPRFSPDGNKVVISMAVDGNSEIYVMDIRTRRQTRLTNHPSIDTSPSFSPDSSKIVFNSDRGGTQQIYTMNADGSNVRRISYGNGRYGTPVWSPRGDLIAFTKIADGEFSIGVMRPDGSGEKILSTSYLVEGPTWSPNGRVITFFRQTPTGNSRLVAIDVTGRYEREIATPTDASDPAWSPLRK